MTINQLKFTIKEKIKLKIINNKIIDKEYPRLLFYIIFKIINWNNHQFQLHLQINQVWVINQVKFQFKNKL